MTMTTKAVLLLGAAMMIHAGGAGAQARWEPTRLTAPPDIDGVLDEAWLRAAEVSGFRTYDPDYGSPMLGDTRVLMGYDDDNLYFAFKAYDPDPSLIRASVTQRDNINQEDWVAINLDSFGDAQSLYAFYVNPLGIQGDSRLAAGNEDRGVDLVWYSAGRIDEEGYTVEIRIPLKSIRFRESDEVVGMGVIFERRISRNSQWGTVPELDPARGGQWATQMHPLAYAGIRNGRVLELLPAATYSVDKEAQAGALATTQDLSDFGLTAKVGLTSDLVFDGTLNPDFSQIEADAGQVDVNLRTNLFFPEKRPFFLEGREHFGLAATGGMSPIRSVIHTRKIVDPIVGTRVSGNLGERNTVATVFALDELGSTPDGETARARVPIVRYKRSLDGDSYVGGVFTARDTDERQNRLAGIDGQYRLGESVLLSMHAMGTRTEEGDSVADGFATGVRVESDTRRYNWSVDVLNVAEDFEPDVGYLTRNGITRLVAIAGTHLYPEVSHVRRIDLQLVGGQTKDLPADLWESYVGLNFANHLLGSLNLRGRVYKASEIFNGAEFDNTGYTVTLGGLLANKGAFGVSYGRETHPVYTAEPFQGRQRSFNAILGYRPWPTLETQTTLDAVRIVRDADSEELFDYTILRSRVTLQPNRFLFVRAIAEYNWYRDELLTDFLASFTYIPGTVVHLGYGSLYDRTRWEVDRYVRAEGLTEVRRRFFFKASYLFRR